MRKIFLLLALQAMCFASCDNFYGIDTERISGNQNLKTETRSATSFTNISSHGAFDVYLTQGSNYGVRIEAEDNLLPYIETRVEDDVLVIDTKDGYSLNNRRDMKVFVTAPAYSRVKTSGSGNIIAETMLNNSSAIELDVSGSGDIKVNLNAPEVHAGLRGSGNILLSGETRNFTGQIRGSGDIKASELKAENVTVDIAGSGNAEVFASVKLNVDVKGSGDVKYRGNAQVSSDIMGSGNVRKVD